MMSIASCEVMVIVVIMEIGYGMRMLMYGGVAAVATFIGNAVVKSLVWDKKSLIDDRGEFQ